MQVVLLERVRRLGQIGDVVTVKNGYARNYLLPQEKALRATKANLELFEAQRKDIEARNLELKSDAEAAATKIEGAQAIIIRQAGEAGSLYGSVSARDVVSALADAGYNVERKNVILDRAIKMLGLYNITLALHSEVSVTISINVARSLEEAEIQAKGEEAKAEAAEAEVSVEDYFENAEDAEAATTADDEATEEAPEAAAEVEAEAETEETE